jgi:hypothetical protein
MAPPDHAGALPAPSAEAPARGGERKSESADADAVGAIRARVVPSPRLEPMGAPRAFPASSREGASAEGRSDGLDDLLAGSLASREAAKKPSRPSSEAELAAPTPIAGTSAGGAAALLRAARATRAANGCVAALPRYRAVSVQYPRTREAGEALLESADCHARLGRASQSRRDLERAARIPATADRARALLAQERSATPAAAPAAP